MGHFDEEPLYLGQDSEASLRRPGAQAEPLDQIKTSLSDAVRKAAGSLDRAIAQNSNQNDAIHRYGQHATAWLERSADYIQDFEPKEVATQVRDEVRRNPGRSLLIAGAAGLALGVIFRRR